MSATANTKVDNVNKVDPRLQVGAYIRRGNALWQVQAHSSWSHTTNSGRLALENAVSYWSALGRTSGQCVHEHITVTSQQVLDEFKLVKTAPLIDHLDQQMERHLAQKRANGDPTTPGSRLAPKLPRGWKLER